MARTKSKSTKSKATKPAVMLMPVGPAGTTFGDSGSTMGERGAIGAANVPNVGPASAPNTPSGEPVEMAY